MQRGPLQDTKDVIIKIPKVKDKERLLKVARKKEVTRWLSDRKGVWEDGQRGEGIKKY